MTSPQGKFIEKLAFVSSRTAEAKAARDHLATLYGDTPAKAADVIVALGGDGLMLQTMHRFMNSHVPIYGMNRGSVGFLMNEYAEEGLLDRIRKAVTTTIHPLLMEAVDIDGEVYTARAINEVSMLRQTYQAAKLKVTVDTRVRLEELICDGILVSTPAGSTAYNLSAHGPLLPINSPLLALTPISPFRPRRWRGALLPNRSNVRIDVLEPDKRPVSAAADHIEIRNVRSVSVAEDWDAESLIMFDPDHGWDERILTEMFRY
ncbi:NAD+ kinase [Breoghania corrubedonensis]|uniref:NAD kinase n=1 Tax=Breoghania corrubedonensis TaxID=665038 RepID=A0A2T5VD01_9HYPH|nr:NAD kinase [Breoghania corrubedonensis]PTW61624.1 NAD+ kinase [Breoghania corrubedonensis]